MSSPSSGFMVPTRMKRAGWVKEMPSRSTTLTPMAAASRSTSTRWSSRRFTSSTYKIPRLAAASSPGSKCFSPLLMARSRSMVPSSRSSVVPEGQVHHRHGPLPPGQGLALGPALAAGVAHQLELVGIAMKRAARHHRHGGQQLRQPPGRGGLGRALLAADQHPADEGIDGIENQGLFKPLLPDQGSEGIDGAFGGHGDILSAFKSDGKGLSPCPLRTRQPLTTCIIQR